MRQVINEVFTCFVWQVINSISARGLKNLFMCPMQSRVKINCSVFDPKALKLFAAGNKVVAICFIISLKLRFLRTFLLPVNKCSVFRPIFLNCAAMVPLNDKCSFFTCFVRQVDGWREWPSVGGGFLDALGFLGMIKTEVVRATKTEHTTWN